VVVVVVSKKDRKAGVALPVWRADGNKHYDLTTARCHWPTGDSSAGQWRAALVTSSVRRVI
jgi:hypothetical protein